jgi:hypothetical protein
MTLMRPILVRSGVDATTSAVPSQLLPTIRTSRSVSAGAEGADTVIDAAASTAASRGRHVIGASEQGVTVR